MFRRVSTNTLQALMLVGLLTLVGCTNTGSVVSEPEDVEQPDLADSEIDLEPWDETTNLAPPIAGPAMNNYSMQRQRWSQLSREGREALRMGQLPQAEQHFLAALEVTENFRRSDVRRRVTLAQLERVARRYETDGLPDGFIRIAGVIVGETQGMSEIEHPGLSNLLIDLGRAHTAEGDFEAAETALSEALAVRIQNEGGKALSLEEIYGLLAGIEFELEKFELAAGHAEQRIALAQYMNSPDERRLTAAEYQLAHIRSEQGRLEDARAGYQRALDNEIALAPSGVDEATVRNALAEVQIKMGHVDQAMILVAQSLAILTSEDIEGPPLGQVLDTKAQTLAAIGKSAEAEDNYKRALEELAEAPPFQRVMVLENYESFLLNQNRHSDASGIRRRIQALDKKPSAPVEVPEVQNLSEVADESVSEGAADESASEGAANESASKEAADEEASTEMTREVAPSNIANPTAETPEWDRGVSELSEGPAS